MGIMNPDETTFDYLRGRECVAGCFEVAVVDGRLWLVMTMPFMTRSSVWMYLILLPW